MTNIEIVLELLHQMYMSDDANDVKKLIGACIAILGVGTKPPMGDAAPKKKAEPAKKSPGGVAKKPGRKPFDSGKLKALLNGGWPVAKIADEMQVSEQTIRNHMKELGL